MFGGTPDRERFSLAKIAWILPAPQLKIFVKEQPRDDHHRYRLCTPARRR